MKKWNSPEICMLGVEKTMTEDDIEVIVDNIHYCHKEEKYHLNGCGHPRNNQDHISDDPDHNWDGQPHVSKCCCAGLS